MTSKTKYHKLDDIGFIGSQEKKYRLTTDQIKITGEIFHEARKEGGQG